MRSFPLPALTLLAASAALLAGCAPGEELGQVSGRVTCEGRPVKEGVVIFANRAKGVYVQARLQANGKYEVEMANGFGLPLGEYVVYVSPPVFDFPVGPPPGGKPPAPIDVSQMPARYRDADATPLRLTVQSGSNRYDIEMKAEGGE